MKAAFDKSAPGEELLDFYPKMHVSYRRALEQGYLYVVAGIDPDEPHEYSVAQVSKDKGDLALQDLGLFCYACAHIRPMLALDVLRPFAEQMQGRDVAPEDYLKNPVINLPERAKNNAHIMAVLFQGVKEEVQRKEDRPVFKVITGGKGPD